MYSATQRMRSSGNSGQIRLYLGYRVSLLSNLISANHDLLPLSRQRNGAAMKMMGLLGEIVEINQFVNESSQIEFHFVHSKQRFHSHVAVVNSRYIIKDDHRNSKFHILAQKGRELLAIQQLKHSYNQILSSCDEEMSTSGFSIVNDQIFFHHTFLFIVFIVMNIKYFEFISHYQLFDIQILQINRKLLMHRWNFLMR